jgi:hypothetical protein
VLLNGGKVLKAEAAGLKWIFEWDEVGSVSWKILILSGD